MTQGFMRRLFGTAALTAAALAAIMAASAGTAAAAKVVVKVGTESIHFRGTVDLSKYVFSGIHSDAAGFRQGASLAAASPSGSWKIEDPAIAEMRQSAGPAVSSTSSTVTTTNVPGERGFAGLTGYDQAVANNNLDLEPPDQGLCAGNGYVGEFINNAFAVYDTNGVQLLNTVPSYVLFKESPTAFFSDPRCYYDAATQRWFMNEFIVGNTSGTVPSIQFLAVSNTSDPLGSWSVWQWTTTDANTPGCPCFGDFDQFGADDNGVYIATNEFSVSPTGPFNGPVIYAISKQTIEQFANTGIPPVLFRYRLTQDYFGQPYHVSPASSPAGAQFAPDTEYFVESNSDANSDDHLAVYALQDTSLLASPQPAPPPPMVSTEIKSEKYSFPPDATQKNGPIPLGDANQDPEGQLQADFNAIQEVTYTGGQLYAEASTATSNGTDGVAWFEIAPTSSSTGITATMTNQGYVRVGNQNLVYPVIAVNPAGNGYMAFALSGPKYYPSAAYIAFTPAGPSGDVMIAAPGVAPEDSFTCYSAFVGPFYGGCRWGDYSMGVNIGSKIWLATEYVPPTSRDYLTNWGTFVWNASAPTTP
jgi:hypothetical protein